MRAPVNPRMEQPILESKPVPTPTTRLVQGGPPPSLGFMLAINSFAFCYGLVITTLGMIILPIEAVYIFPEAHAVMLAVMLGCTGVAQLISPVTGYLSDRSTSQFGRRRPIMVLGAVIAGVGTLGMSMSHYHQQQVVYVVSLVLTVFGLNCSYSSYTALLPDFIAPEFMGRASGIMACLTTLGSFAGFALLGFLLEATDAYPLYFATIAGSVILTCCIAPEKQLEKALPIKLSELVASYTIDSHAYPDFFWVCVTRTFYYMGISVQAFSLFMLRDVQKVGDPKYWIAIFSMVAQISAGVVAIPSGKLSDRTGRKPMVYVSCVFMGGSYLGYAATPSVQVLMAVSILFGLGNGIFLSVDYALATDVLPSLDSAAESLGVWGVSAFLGSTIGPLIAGPLLELVSFARPAQGDVEYSRAGYTAVMILGAFYCGLAGVILARTVQAR